MENLHLAWQTDMVSGGSAVTKKGVGQVGRSGVWALLWGWHSIFSGRRQHHGRRAQGAAPGNRGLGVPAMMAPLCGSQVILSPSLALICSKFSGQPLSDHREAVSFVV